MRDLFDEEADDIGIEQHAQDEGSRLVLTGTSELAGMRVGTDCGTGGNTCFIDIAGRFPHRGVYAEVLEVDGQLCVIGTPLIQCTPQEAEEIEEIAMNADGSLRADGMSNNLNGYCLFEVE